jgi:hypothetical protein
VVRRKIVEAAGFLITAARRTQQAHPDPGAAAEASTFCNTRTSLNVIRQ